MTLLFSLKRYTFQIEVHACSRAIKRFIQIWQSRRSNDRMLVALTITCATSAYHH